MFRETKLASFGSIFPAVSCSLAGASKVSVGVILGLSMVGCAYNGGQKEGNGILPFFANTPLEVSMINARIDGQTSQLSEMADQLEQLSGMVAQLQNQMTIEKPNPQADLLATIPTEDTGATDINSSKVRSEAVEGVAEQPNLKTVIGSVEWVWADSLNTHMRARIDTGAALSSLNAVDVKIYEKDGKRWTRFTVLAEDEDARRQLRQKKSSSKNTTAKDSEDDDGLLWVIDTPVERFVKIRQAASDKVERRPVVRLPIRLGPIQEMTEFTLSNRQQMNFPMLLGRSFLQDLAIVDVSERYLTKKQWVSKQVSRPNVEATNLPGVKEK